MCKPGTRFCLLRRDGRPGLAFYGRGPARLPSWLGIVNAGWLGSMRLKMFKAAHQTGCFFTWAVRPLKSIPYSATFACSRMLFCIKR